uniref:Phage tail tape measure protein, TP901 family, core region n=1 Tax=Candidatus Kentrum sp. LPFa TaxID=2126335 RepID=A0A450WK82_9GAMM|nr:MAG: phage tail tape measure protein, TP901 family, core region [Candidatus Kentron sp. LPFa]
MDSTLFNVGLMLTATDRMSGVVMSAADRSIQGLGRVQERIAVLSDQAIAWGRGAMMGGMAMAGSVAGPLMAFAHLEDASVSLKSALLDSTGKVPPQFAAIEKQATSLGNILPGTTADFLAGARALSEQGVAMDTILKGGLKSASYLSVVLKMPAQEAAEMTAKLREAFGLADNELTKMADLTQRARFAFGMTPQEIKLAASYSGSTQNTLGLTGLDNAGKLLAMQGLGAGVALEGSSWGTSLAMMLTRTAEAGDKLGSTGKVMGPINDQLRKVGINLQFFDDKGSFMGLDNLVAQLEKTEKLSQSDQLNLFKQIFGVEAGRAASIIARKGVAGYEAAIEKMEKQASLQQRIDLQLTTIRNTWEALTGTATNALALIGQPIAGVIRPYITQLNDFVGGPLMTFIEEHKTLVGTLGASLLVLGLLTVALGGLGMAVGTLGKFVAGGIGVFRKLALASRFAVGWIASQRLALLRLMGVERAHVALMNLQNAIAYRGGAWQALQYSLMTTRYRMLSLLGATRAWVALLPGRLAGGVITATTALWGWTRASLAWGRVNLLTLTGLRGLAAGFGRRLLAGIRGATLAVRAFSVALLMNPVVLIATAIAGAALLIYKYWKPIGAFFGGLWEGLASGLAPLAPAFGAFARVAASVFRPILALLKPLWGWFSAIFTQVEDTGGAARNLGVAVGEGIGAAIAWVGELGLLILSLPVKFFDAGVAIVKGLGEGIASFASHPIEAIKGIGAGIAGAFKEMLGIKSPSRVFMGFGDNIGQGAALGIEGSLPAVQKAMVAMAGATHLPAHSPAHPLAIGGPVAIGPVSMPARGGNRGAAGEITIHFSPVIQVSGAHAPDAVKSALREGYAEFEAHMRRFEAERRRSAF